MPFVDERPAVETPPVNVDVPRPETVRTLPTLNDVLEAIGRIDEPVTLSPPCKIVSPAETRRPREEASPADETPPVKVVVPEPVMLI